MQNIKIKATPEKEEGVKAREGRTVTTGKRRPKLTFSRRGDDNKQVFYSGDRVLVACQILLDEIIY